MTKVIQNINKMAKVIQNVNKMDKVSISLRKLQAHDLKTLLTLALYADKKEFIQEFANSGVVFVDNPEKYDEQLDFLTYLGESGADKGGKLRKPDGTPVHFSVWACLSRINVSHDEMDKAPIKIVY